MATIIDPTDRNIALVDGAVAHAVRIAKVTDPSAPTVAELLGGSMIGYGTFTPTQQ